MCVKSNAVKRLFLVMSFPIYKQPTVLCVVKQYPLYRQLYEDTKNRDLSVAELQRLGVKPPMAMSQSTVRMIEAEIPFEKLF